MKFEWPFEPAGTTVAICLFLGALITLATVWSFWGGFGVGIALAGITLAISLIE